MRLKVQERGAKVSVTYFRREKEGQGREVEGVYILGGKSIHKIENLQILEFKLKSD